MAFEYNYASSFNDNVPVYHGGLPHVVLPAVYLLVSLESGMASA